MNFRRIESLYKFLIILLCFVCVHGIWIWVHTCEDQRTIFRNPFSPSTMRLLGSNSERWAWEHTLLPTKQSHQLFLESSDTCLHKYWVKQAYEGLSLEGLVFLCSLSSVLKPVQSLSLSFSYNKMSGSLFSQRVCVFVSGDWKEGSLGCCHWRHHVLEHGIFATCRGQILTPHFWSQFMWSESVICLR